MTAVRRLRLFSIAVVLALLAQLGTVPAASAATIASGNYYASTPPDDGAPDNAGGLVGFAGSRLFNGDETDLVGWRGSGTAAKTVTLVFDLLRDQPLSGIGIRSQAPNEFWTFDEIRVTYRAEAETSYRVAAEGTRARGQASYALDVAMANRTARFVRIALTRTNQWLHIPMSEVSFTLGSGPIDQDPAPPYVVEQMKAEVARDTLLVDTFGQYLYQDWAGKVTTDEQLRQDARREATELAGAAPDLTTYDRYGGMKSLGNRGGTGFFRLEKIDGAWWFVTPDGYPYFLKGIDSVTPQDGGYATLYKHPDGSPRQVFEALPDPTAYPAAYDGDTVNFVKANLMRKYGANYLTPWRDITTKRMLHWGFNAQSKWSRDAQLPFPYIGRITAPPDVLRIQWAVDPFDPQFGTKLDQHIRITGAATDPLLIGYFFENERGWNNDVVADVLRRNATQPAKQAFVDYMSAAYGGDLDRVNAVLGTNASSFDELANTVIAIGSVPAADVKGYVVQASKAYYGAVRQAIRKQDANHLFLGSALVPTWRSSLEWNVGGREHLDAISLDVYSDNAGYLAEYEPFDKPVLNLEYSFSTQDRGLRAINLATRAATIAERGAKHKAFLEAQAASPVFVGSGWFVGYDQPVTGRAADGENYNFGLVNQQDQPYTAMTDQMRVTNRGLEAVHRAAGRP